MKQGKPIALPGTAGEPRGTLLGLRVKDRGGSKGSSVMEEIQAASSLARKREDFHGVFHGEKA